MALALALALPGTLLRRTLRQPPQDGVLGRLFLLRELCPGAYKGHDVGLPNQGISLSKALAVERKVLTRNHRVVGQHLGAEAALARVLGVGSAVVRVAQPSQAARGMAHAARERLGTAVKDFERL